MHWIQRDVRLLHRRRLIQPGFVRKNCDWIREGRQIQSFRLPILRVGYYDARRVIGVVTEIVGSTEAGPELRRNLTAGNFGGPGQAGFLDRSRLIVTIPPGV